MKYLRALIFSTACAVSPPAFAQTWAHLADVHLPVIPRSPEDQARIQQVTAPSHTFDKPERYEAFPAGAATVQARIDADAFSQPSENTPQENRADFRLGNGLFRVLWRAAPSPLHASDGLGPLFNARSCQLCHLKDGRGHPPSNPTDDAVSLFLRVSIPGGTDAATQEIQDYISTTGDPTYGTQLQDFAVDDHPAETRLKITYLPQPVTLADGTVITLQSPSYDAEALGYGPLHPDAMLSPRIAPQMIGLGLLEAIPVADIIAMTDPEDQNQDGISGRANVVWSLRYNQPMLGRFGHKAGSPTIEEQTAAAFAGDIGISTSLFPSAWGECTSLQPKCRAAPHGSDHANSQPELDDARLELVTYYSQNLGVPARRDVNDPQVLRGKALFYASGCTGCHTPKFVTHDLENQPEQNRQLIWPYTDLLLHDMGDELADNRPEGRATGREWRTPPLWGIGLTQQVSGHTNFLHDGRARTLLEAVLWHAGEAQTARDKVVQMSKSDREDLLRFLESL